MKNVLSGMEALRWRFKVRRFRGRPAGPPPRCWRRPRAAPGGGRDLGHWRGEWNARCPGAPGPTAGRHPRRQRQPAPLPWRRSSPTEDR